MVGLERVEGGVPLPLRLQLSDPHSLLAGEQAREIGEVRQEERFLKRN